MTALATTEVCSAADSAERATETTGIRVLEPGPNRARRYDEAAENQPVGYGPRQTHDGESAAPVGILVDRPVSPSWRLDGCEATR